jgi:predicted  nucleic acid-binding Zn-ribbon protein
MPEFPSARVHDSHALAVYAEPLAAGSRVVVVGDATSGLGARLMALGARMVHIYDPDATRARRVAESSRERGVIVRELPSGEFDVRDGAFDLALVPDLALYPYPSELLARLRRLVAAEGAVLVAARTGGASGQATATGTLDYYELYDAVSLQFSHVRMIGQLPFYGVALAELGDADDAPQVAVDTQLADPSRGPDVFVALGSQRDVRLEPYALVQLPSAPEGSFRDTSPPRPVESLDTVHELDSDRVALAQALLRAETLTREVERQNAEIDRLSRALADAPQAERYELAVRQSEERLDAARVDAAQAVARADRLAGELATLEAELQKQRDRSFRLTRELEDEKALRARAETELGAAQKSPEVPLLRARAGELEQKLAAAVERIRELEAALRATEEGMRVMQARLRQIEALAAERASKLEVARAEVAHYAEVHAHELTQFEAVLRERAQTIKALQEELVRRERMVHELVSALEDIRDGVPEAAAPAIDRGAIEIEIEPYRRELARFRTESEGLKAQLDALRGELGSRSDQLAAALRRAAEAERALADAEQRAPAANEAVEAELRRRLDALALEAARREADVQTSQWRIAELEQRLALTEQARANVRVEADPRVPELEREVGRCKDELEILRRALSQEHEARKRLESGEELERARAEVSRQAVLIEQLSRELDARGLAPAPNQVHDV